MRCRVTEPVTPARDPASIDRRGLVGVGELATPQWTRGLRADDDEDQVDLALHNDDGDYDREDPDSPWTIEARDGEIESMDQVGRPSSTPLCRTDHAPSRSGSALSWFLSSRLPFHFQQLPTFARFTFAHPV